MKYLFTAVTSLMVFIATAQPYLDYQDTRKKNESFVKLPPGEIRKDLAAFTLGGISESVGKEEFKKIPFTAFGKDFMAFEGDGIKATITTQRFDPSKHKFTYDDKYLTRIDKRTYYGGYGSMPKTYVSNITLTINNDSVSIPQAAYADLFNLNFTYSDNGVQRSTNGIYKSKDGNRIYLYVFSKDNSGSYEVTWIIQDKQYIRRVLNYGIM
ncbi:MAG: hypothetical protein ABIO82_07935 [Ginsengibacter sp.]